MQKKNNKVILIYHVTCRHKIVDEMLGTYIPKQEYGKNEIGPLKIIVV